MKGNRRLPFTLAGRRRTLTRSDSSGICRRSTGRRQFIVGYLSGGNPQARFVSILDDDFVRAYIEATGAASAASTASTAAQTSAHDEAMSRSLP